MPHVAQNSIHMYDDAAAAFYSDYTDNKILLTQYINPSLNSHQHLQSLLVRPESF